MPPEPRDAKPYETTLAFDDNRLASVVFGHYDQNLAAIERKLGVTANANGNHVIIKGPKEAAEQARRVFEMLYERARQGQAADPGGAMARTSHHRAAAGERAPAGADAPGDRSMRIALFITCLADTHYSETGTPSRPSTRSPG